MILLLATPPKQSWFSGNVDHPFFFGKPLASGKLHCDFMYVKASGLI